MWELTCSNSHILMVNVMHNHVASYILCSKDFFNLDLSTENRWVDTTIWERQS